MPQQKRVSRLLDATEKLKFAKLIDEYLKTQYKGITLDKKSLKIGSETIAYSLGYETKSDIQLIQIGNLVHFNKMKLSLLLSRANIIKAYLEKVSTKNVEIAYVYLYDSLVAEDTERKSNYEIYARRIAGDIRLHFVDICKLEPASNTPPSPAT